MRSSRADACTDRLPGGVELSLTGPSGGPVVLGSNEVLGTCLSRLRPRATASSREGSTTTRCVGRPLSIGCQTSSASAGSMTSSTATSIPDSAKDRTRAHVAVTDACHCSACPGSPTARRSTSPCTSRPLTVSSWTWAATSRVWHHARARVDLPAPAGPANNLRSRQPACGSCPIGGLRPHQGLLGGGRVSHKTIGIRHSGR